MYCTLHVGVRRGEILPLRGGKSGATFRFLIHDAKENFFFRFNFGLLLSPFFGFVCPMRVFPPSPPPSLDPPQAANEWDLKAGGRGGRRVSKARNGLALSPLPPPPQNVSRCLLPPPSLLPSKKSLSSSSRFSLNGHKQPANGGGRRRHKSPSLLLTSSLSPPTPVLKPCPKSLIWHSPPLPSPLAPVNALHPLF